MITCEERKNRLLKANNLMKRLNLNSILVVGNGSVATNEYGFYRYFVDNRVYYHQLLKGFGHSLLFMLRWWYLSWLSQIWLLSCQSC